MIWKYLQENEVASIFLFPDFLDVSGRINHDKVHTIWGFPKYLGGPKC